MKLIFSLVSLILLSMMPLNTYDATMDKDEFYDNCNDSYYSYALESEYVTESYSLNILIGEYDSLISYSIYFELKDSADYELYIKKENAQGYYPTSNSRGNCAIYNLLSNSDISIEVHQGKIATYLYELKETSLSDYKEKYEDKSTFGSNKGFSHIENQNNQNNQIIQEIKKSSKITFILSIVFLGIILLSIVILLITFIKKKGFFNEEKFNKEFEKEHEIRNTINEFINTQDNSIEVEAEEIKEQEEVKEVYQKQKNYEFEEIRDISILLKEKGFNTNYSEMSNNDKNEVMVELMKMRHMKEITDEEYQSEIIKLWM